MFGQSWTADLVKEKGPNLVCSPESGETCEICCGLAKICPTLAKLVGCSRSGVCEVRRAEFGM